MPQGQLITDSYVIINEQLSLTWHRHERSRRFMYVFVAQTEEELDLWPREQSNIVICNYMALSQTNIIWLIPTIYPQYQYLDCLACKQSIYFFMGSPLPDPVIYFPFCSEIDILSQLDWQKHCPSVTASCEIYVFGHVSQYFCQILWK